MRILLFIQSIIIGLLLSVSLLIAGEPVLVPLKIVVTCSPGATPSGAAVYATVPNPNYNPGANAWSVESSSHFSASAGYVPDEGWTGFVPQLLTVEVGREIDLSIVRYGTATTSAFTLTPPPGHSLSINGLVRNRMPVSSTGGTFKIRVLPELDSKIATAGTATEFSSNQVKWAVSLGSDKNGNSSGWMWIVGAGLGSWDQFLTPANLHCARTSSEVVVEKVGALVRQVRSNEAIIDIISPETTLAATVPAIPAGDGIAYEMRFYNPSRMSVSGTIRTPLSLTDHPYVVYRVKANNPVDGLGLRIEKIVYGLENGGPKIEVRREYTEVLRSGTNAKSYKWTYVGWTHVDAPATIYSVAQWEPYSLPGQPSYYQGGYRENYETRDTGVVPHKISEKSRSTYLAPETDYPLYAPAPSYILGFILPPLLVSDIQNPDAATASQVNHDYYYDTLDHMYSCGLPRVISSNGGSWGGYSYINPATRVPVIPVADRDKWIGVVESTFAPLKDAGPPVASISESPTPAANILTTTYDYEKDAFDYPSRKTLIETYYGAKAPANLVDKKHTQYTARTINSLACIEAATTAYSRTDKATTSSITYVKEDNASSFLRGMPMVESSAAGEKKSYARSLGTFAPALIQDNETPLSFTISTTGAFSRVIEINGVVASGEGAEATATSTESGVAIGAIYLLPGRSLKKCIYRDIYAKVVREETYLRSFTSSWVMVGWKNYSYNLRHKLIRVVDSVDGTHDYYYSSMGLPDQCIGYSASGPSGEYVTREVDANGVDKRYFYDIFGRLKKTIKMAIPLPGEAARPDLVTEFTYDASDRVVEEVVYASDAPALAFITNRVYDLAGRMVSEKSSGSPEMSYAYDPVNRRLTVTNLGTAATRIIESYRDKQVKSVTGVGVVPLNYDYGFTSLTTGSSLSYWSTVKSGPVGSDRTAKVWLDWFGRNVKSESAAPPNIAGPLVSEISYGPITTAATYDSNGALTAPAIERGLPISTTTPGSSAIILGTYGALGEVKLAGLDADLSGALEAASAKDRISGTRRSSILAEGAWWTTSELYTYPSVGSAVETIVGKTWTRLTGWSAGLVAETRTWDIEGNLSRRTVVHDRATRKTTISTWTPGIANPQIEEVIDGLLISVTAPDGLVASTVYDGLRRPIKSVTPRSGVNGGIRELLATYKLDVDRATTLIESLTEGVAPDLRTTNYTYDAAFRVTKTTNPDGKTSEQRFDSFGRVTHVFGSAISPVRYVYNDYGERIEQHTFRDTTKLFYASEADFLLATDARTDVVKWDYHPATGVLLKKTDPLGRFVAYDYDPAGRIKNSYWARHKTPGSTAVPVEADRLTATPSYDPATGDLLSISYNDGITPTISTTYSRLGAPLTISDAAGTRSFLRDAQKPWRVIAELLPSHYGAGRALTRLYEEQTAAVGQTGLVTGRSRGFQLGTLAQPASLLEHTMAFDASGRMRNVTAARDGSGIRQSFAYTYTANSRLLETLSASGTGFVVTRTWDPIRDLLDKIETKSGSATYAKFEFTYTKLGQRATSAQSGEAFTTHAGDSEARLTTYTYDDRGQVDSAVTSLASGSIPGRRFAFDYDLAGNRVKSDHQGSLTASTAVSYVVSKGDQLIQRDNPSASVSGIVSYDGFSSESAVKVAADNQPVNDNDRRGSHWQKDLALAEGSKLPNPTETTEQTTGRNVSDVDSGTGEVAARPNTLEFPRKGRQITTVAAKPAGGAAGADLAAFDRIDLLLAPRDEQLRYDRDGNLLRDGTWAYTWDAENNLVKAETHAWLLGRIHYRLTFKYDYQGRRISKAVQTKTPDVVIFGPATETRFLYDGWDLIGEFDASSPSTATTPRMDRSYAWGLDLAGNLASSGGVGALLQITDHVEGQTYFPGYDGNGNVTLLVRASDGFRAAAYEYGPFGEVLRAEGLYAAKNPFRFSTKFTDVETGLVYYGLRYYDARNGRFVSKDPIDEWGGRNLYGFCGNDGVNRFDILGLHEDGEDEHHDDEIVELPPLEVVGTPVRDIEWFPGGGGWIQVELLDGSSMEPGKLLQIPGRGLFRATEFLGVDANGTDYWDGVWIIEELTDRLGESINRELQALERGVNARNSNFSQFADGFSNSFTWQNAAIGLGVGVGLTLLAPVSPLIGVGALIVGVAGVGVAGIDIALSDNPYRTAGEFAGGAAAGSIGGGVGNIVTSGAKRAISGSFAQAADSETALLQAHLRNAVARFEAEGFTPGQLRAMAKSPDNPGLAAANRGTQIDTFFKQAVSTDPRLSHLELTPRAKFGPDVFNPVNQTWWDVTTPGKWNMHVQKYWLFGDGTPLFTQ